MNTWVRKSLSVGVLAAGAVLFGQAAAQADTSTSGNFGILNGTQAIIPVQTVADVCGNGVSAGGGVAFAACEGGADAVQGQGASSPTTTDNYGIGNGTQVYAPIQTVISACGNSISLIGGVSFAECEGGASGQVGGEEGPGGGPGGGYESTKVTKLAGSKAGKAGAGTFADEASALMTSGNYGIANGTQVYAPIQTAISLCGNSITAVGGIGFAACEGGASGENATGGVEGATTSSNYGVLSGTQVIAPIQTVADVSGNAVAAVGGVAFADSVGGAHGSQAASETESARAGAGGMTTSDQFGIANGTQVFAPIQTVADVSGNAVSAVGGVAFANSTGGAWGHQ